MLPLFTAALFVSAQDHPASAPPDTEPLKVCSKSNPPPCATAPKVFFQPDPEYTKEARKKKVQGTVILHIVVGTDGHTYDIRVTQSVGHGLNEEAIKAVRQWKFEPGTKDGKPVPVSIDVEVDFRLY